MKKLYPPLAEIEDILFSPSDELISRWSKGDPSLSPGLRQALENDERAMELKQWSSSLDVSKELLEDNSSKVESEIQASSTQLSHRLQEMIRKHVAARDQFSEVNSAASPGQIRLVDKAISPKGTDLGWDIGRPLAVLLLRQTEVEGVWYGWPLANETDYASYWDVLLEEEDEPFDPYVAMVQLWNPVKIFDKSLGRVIGKLSSERLATMSAAFKDLIGGEKPGPEHAAPGTLVSRLTKEGHPCLTGTPLGEADDPRNQYQRLYFAAAGFIKDQAELVFSLQEEMDARTPTLSMEHFLQGIREFAESIFQPIQEPVIAYPMGPEKESESDFAVRKVNVGSLFSCTIDPTNIEVIRLVFRRSGNTNLTIELEQGGNLLARQKLNESSPEVVIVYSPREGEEAHVFFTDSTGREGKWQLAP